MVTTGMPYTNGKRGSTSPSIPDPSVKSGKLVIPILQSLHNEQLSVRMKPVQRLQGKEYGRA